MSESIPAESIPAQSSRKSAVVRRAKAVAVFVLRTLLIFAIVEGAVSLIVLIGSLVVIGKQTAVIREGQLFDFDPELGWMGIPKRVVENIFGSGIHVHLNAMGLRQQRDVTTAKPTGRRRIVCSGDSFTFGVGVGDEEHWCRRLEVLDPTIETVNLGQPGYGLDQMFLLYRKHGAELEQDIHVIAFIADDVQRMRRKTTVLGQTKPYLSLRDGQIVVNGTPLQRFGASGAWTVRAAGAAGDLRVVQGLRFIGLGPRKDKDTGALDERGAADVAQAIFVESKRLADKHGAPTVVVYLPVKTDLEGVPYQPAYWAARATESGVHFVDLTPSFAALSPSERDAMFISAKDAPNTVVAGHYTARGQALVADVVAARLKELLQGERAHPGEGNTHP